MLHMCLSFVSSLLHAEKNCLDVARRIRTLCSTVRFTCAILLSAGRDPTEKLTKILAVRWYSFSAAAERGLGSRTTYIFFNDTEPKMTDKKRT